MSTLTTNEMELLTNLAQEIGATKYHRRVTVEFDQSRAIQAELEAAIKTNLPGKYVLIDGSHEAKTTSLRLHPLEPLTEEEKNKLTAMAEQIGTTSFHIQVTVDFQ